MAVNSSLITNLYLQPVHKVTRTKNVLFKDLNEVYSITGLLYATDPEWVLRPQWDYVVSVTFDGKDNNRGQLFVNGTQIFDSHTTGSGTNRVTTAWGKVSDSGTTSMVQGSMMYYSRFILTGTGNVRINGPLTVEWIRVRK